MPSYIVNIYHAILADPVNLAVSKIAPALMAGNTVVVKPPTQARLCELAQCRHNLHVLLIASTVLLAAPWYTPGFCVSWHGPNV